ncbi:MAG: ATP-binding protein [Fidelibacterota bacterium]
MSNAHIKRQISSLIDDELSQERPMIILILGQRRSGKTWELRRLEKEREEVLYFDFEDISQRNILQPVIAGLEEIIGEKSGVRLLALDEIQYLDQAGSILKLIYDYFPQTSVVVTGSASFFMMRNIGDSLYGRHLSLNLFPLTFREIVGEAANLDYILSGYDNPLVRTRIEEIIPTACVYGTLPEVYLEGNRERKQAILKNYVTSLLFKDIFEIEGIRNPRVFQKLLQFLGLQLGSEINPNEIARQLGISRRTVLEYIGLYEKFHILHLLRSYSTNPRKEISKGFKVYFSDLGIRNAVINNFTPVDSRTDRDGMFENLVINLFTQNRSYFSLPWELYFWRNTAHAEVDLVIHNTETGKLTPVEIKYSHDKKPTRSFANIYNNRVEEGHCVTSKNLWRYI